MKRGTVERGGVVFGLGGLEGIEARKKKNFSSHGVVG